MPWEVIAGDCYDVLPTLSGTFDAIIVDPPYGTTQLAWDVALDWPLLFLQMRRLLAPSGTLLVFSAQPFTTDLIVAMRSWYRYELMWEKTTATRFLDANRRPLQRHEHIQVFGPGRGFYAPQRIYVGDRGKNVVNRVDHGAMYSAGGKPTSYRDDGWRHPTTILKYPKPNRFTRNSPAEKPVELLRWLLRSYTPEGARVLDFCAGSGSTAIAGMIEGRSGVCIESNPASVSIIHRRITEWSTL